MLSTFPNKIPNFLSNKKSITYEKTKHFGYNRVINSKEVKYKDEKYNSLNIYLIRQYGTQN